VLNLLTSAPVRRPARFAVVETNDTTMPRIAGPLLACALALANAPAHAHAGATPATPDHSSKAGAPNGDVAQTPTVDDICRALEQSAAENALPVEFFAGVIWQESRFDAQAVSPKGAAGIARFQPASPLRSRTRSITPLSGLSSGHARSEARRR
jgi:soluble lytic murein transglycosylase-like protein